MLGSIGIKSTIVIPPKCSGLTISGAGCNFFSKISGIVAFKVQGKFISLCDIVGFDPNLIGYFSTFVETEDTAGYDPPAFTRLYRCSVTADRLFIGQYGSGAVIDGCRQGKFNSTTSAPIELDGSDSFVIGNYLSDGGGDAITIMAGSSNCRVIANNCNGADITSSASSGKNVISSNVRVGTITSHATDAVGLNT